MNNFYTKSLGDFCIDTSKILFFTLLLTACGEGGDKALKNVNSILNYPLKQVTKYKKEILKKSI